MKLVNWMKAKKQKSKEKRQEKLARERALNTGDVQLFDAGEPAITPPETRFTAEYQEFLKQQEAAAENAASRE